MGTPECFTTLNETGKQPVPNAGTELGPGIGCSGMLGTGNFPDFWGKILFLGNGIQECRPLLEGVFLRGAFVEHVSLYSTFSWYKLYHMVSKTVFQR